MGSSSLRFLDYGARMYDPTTVRWLTQDPMAEKYYGYSPYNYCVGNPVLYVDPNGTETYVQDKGEGKYQVCGGKLNDDRNLYLMDENNKFVLDQKGNRQSIGESMTNYSFYDEETERWHDDVIDFNDRENFVYERTHNLMPLRCTPKAGQTTLGVHLKV